MLINKTEKGSDDKLPELEDKDVVVLEKIPQTTKIPLVPDSSTTKQRFSPLIRQCFAATGPTLLTIAAGMVSGYSAVLLPQLQEEKGDITINPEQASWIASLGALPMAIGCVIGGVLMEKFGRRFTNIAICIPAVIGWAVIAMSSNLVCLLIGRLITGLTVGLLAPTGAVYIGETSEPKYRGFLLASVSLAVAIGILLSHLLGTFLHWKLTAILTAIFPFTAYIIMTCVPESPPWLLSKGRIDDAEKAFKWLRGSDMDTITEFQTMVDKHLTVEHDKESTKQSFKERFLRPGFIKPLVIILIFFFIMQFSGVNAIAFYSVAIMKETIGVGVNEYLAMLMVDVVRLVMSVVACILVRNFSRRPLTVLSGVGTAISLFGLSLFLYLASKNEEYKTIAWIPLACLLGYICFISIGIVPLPWCLTGELFPIDLRGLGSGIASSWNFIVFFTVVKSGPNLFKDLGPEGAFLIYGCVAFFGTIFLYFFLPETKNKTLQEIEDSFNIKNNIDKVPPSV